jgi:hypothetical protein
VGRNRTDTQHTPSVPSQLRSHLNFPYSCTVARSQKTIPTTHNLIPLPNQTVAGFPFLFSFREKKKYSSPSNLKPRQRPSPSFINHPNIRIYLNIPSLLYALRRNLTRASCLSGPVTTIVPGKCPQVCLSGFGAVCGVPFSGIEDFEIFFIPCPHILVHQEEYPRSLHAKLDDIVPSFPSFGLLTSGQISPSNVHHGFLAFSLCL